MGVQRSDQAARRGRAHRARAAGLGVLLGVLAALLAFLLVHGSSSRTKLASCAGEKGAPEVRRVAPRALSRLRDDVSRLAPQRLARLYEEGTVMSRSAWTDEQPAAPAVSPTAPRPDGYEMRWWAPNGDNLVADELVFANAATAQRFVRMAASVRCRRKALQRTAISPPSAWNLSWLNPEGIAQADVFFARGATVFRLTDVPAGQHGGSIRAGSLSKAFHAIDAIACLLPDAHCLQERSGEVPV